MALVWSVVVFNGGFAAGSRQVGTTALVGAKAAAALPTTVFAASGQTPRWDKDRYLSVIMKIVLISTDSLKGLAYAKTVFAVWSCPCDS